MSTYINLLINTFNSVEKFWVPESLKSFTCMEQDRGCLERAKEKLVHGLVQLGGQTDARDPHRCSRWSTKGYLGEMCNGMLESWEGRGQSVM